MKLKISYHARRYKHKSRLIIHVFDENDELVDAMAVCVGSILDLKDGAHFQFPQLKVFGQLSPLQKDAWLKIDFPNIKI